MKPKFIINVNSLGELKRMVGEAPAITQEIIAYFTFTVLHNIIMIQPKT
jgi:hypothetical protein